MRAATATRCCYLLTLLAPAGVAGAQAEGGRAWTVAARVEHAAFAHPDVPSAVIHAPAHLDATRPLQLVVFLHGYKSCAPVLMGEGAVVCRPGQKPHTGWALARHHDRAGTNTLLVIPQLALMQRDGSPGCFAREGCFRRFLQELLQGAIARQLGAPRSLSDVAGISLVAHSAGFQTALVIAQRGQLGALLRHIVLLDALYAGTSGFARWLLGSAHTKLVSIHLGRGKTARNSDRLYRLVRGKLGAGAAARADAKSLSGRVAKHRLVVARGRGPHGQVPARHLAELLPALWPPAGVP